jgi:EmrB/QacA subfamily drug resistance transporter
MPKMAKAVGKTQLETKWWTLIVVCAATFMLLLDVTIVNVALPSIQHELKANFTYLQWIVDAYALALATVVLNAGSLADRYGRKKLFTIGLIVFTLASALCGASTSPLMLDIARAIQGIGGGIMFATSLSLLAQDFHGPERGVAFGVWGAVTGAAVAVGPLIGGVITSYIDWRWIFYVNLPIGLITIALTYWKTKESRNTTETKTDWWGALMLSGSLFCLIYALTEADAWGWSSTKIVTLFAVAIIVLMIFLAYETYVKQPILQLKLFRKPSFSGAQIAALTLSGSIFALFLYLTLYFQDVLGYTPLQAGLRFLPMTLIIFVVAAIAGRLSSKIPGKLMISIGLLLVSIGLLMSHGLTIYSSWTHILPGLMVAGFGAGMVNPSLANVAIGVVPPKESGMASGVNNTFRQVGIAGGVAVLGALLQNSIRNSLNHSIIASHLTATQLTNSVSAISSGESSLVVKASPLRLQHSVGIVAHQAFINGLNDLFYVTAAVALAGAILSLLLIRRKDLAVYNH